MTELPAQVSREHAQPGMRFCVGRRSALLWALILIFGIASLAVHIAGWDVQTVSMIWGVSLFVIGILVALFGDDEFDMFSPIFFFGMSFAIFYGMSTISPFFLGESFYSHVTNQILPYYPLAGLVSYLCLAGFFAGYKNHFPSATGSRTSLLYWKGSNTSLMLLWSLLLGAGVLAFIILLANNAYLQSTTELQSPLFYSAVGFIQQGLVVSLALAIVMASKGRSRFWLAAAVATVMVALLFGIPSGSKTQVFLAFMIAGLAWNYHVKFISRSQAVSFTAIVLVLLLFLMPLNATYRATLESSDSQEQTLSTSFEFIGIAVKILGDQDFSETKDLAVNYFFSRLSNTSIVAGILRYQDEGGQIHYGGSYLRFFYGLIPRFIWPEKPPVTIGQIFAVELGYNDAQEVRLGEPVSITSVGVTMIGEQVYNFTYLLAPFGMFILGMFYRWLYEVFLSAKSDYPEVAIAMYSYWWYGMIFSAAETNFAAILIGGIKFTAFLMILLVLFRFRKIKYTDGLTKSS